MGDLNRWKQGEHIMFRGVWRQRLWFAAPATIVQDTQELIAFYWRSGNPEKIPPVRLTPLDLQSLDHVDLIDRVWEKTDVLTLAIPGAAHTVMAMWDSGHTRFRCWYVNLQDPLRRTPIGFDTIDHLLDVVVSPDREKWHWKDEDEFSEAGRIGLYSSQELQAIRSEGELAVELLQAEDSPYLRTWVDWTPPSSWTTPPFFPGWDDLSLGNDCNYS